MKSLFLICLLLGPVVAFAQEKIPVVIRLVNAADSTDSVSAVVVIKDENGKEVFAQNISSQDTFRATPGRKYFLSTSAVPFVPVEKFFSVKDTMLLLPVLLKSGSKELKGVVVKAARKPFIRLEDDKEIVDAEPLAVASSSAYEVLEKTPGAVVVDGNIYINSSTPAVIQINGRDIQLRGEDLSALLKSLPANAIVRVEVLRTPSAKYTSSSSGGIINIVLRKGVKLGRSGSANITSQQGVMNSTSVGAGLSQTIGDNTSYIGYQFSSRHNFQRLTTLRQASAEANIDQSAYTRFSSQNHNLRGGIDRAFSPRFSLAYDGMGSYTDGGNTVNNQNDISLSGTNAGSVLSGGDNPNKTVYLSNVITAKWKPDTLGSSWDNVLDYKIYADDGRQTFRNALEGSTNFSQGRGTRNSTNHMITLQSDYTGILGKGWKAETGLRFDMNVGRTNADFETDTNGRGFRPNAFQSAHFGFQQRIAAGYAQVSKLLFWGITVKPGLRVENTFMDGQQTYPQRADFTIARTDVFPYLYLRRNLWKMFKTPLVATLTYRRSIERPGFDMLNPAPRYIDQFLYDIGNPALRPQLTDKYEYNVTFWDFPVFTVGYRDNKNLFTNVSYQDSTSGIAFRTYDNLGGQKEYYFRLVGGIPPTIGKYFFFASAEYTYRKFNGFYGDKPFQFNRGSWALFTFHQFKWSKTFNVSAHAFWLINGFERFYELQNFGFVNASASKTLMDGKLAVTVSLNDIFRTNRQTFILSQPGIYATGNRAEDTRRFGITLRYNFGIKEKEKKGSSPFGSMEQNGQ